MLTESLLESFHSQVLRRGSSEALVHREERWTYAELWSAVRSLGRNLLDSGIRPGDKVAIYMDSGPAYVISCYAVMSVGAVSVLVNTGFRGAQLQEMLQHSLARLVLTSPSRSPRLAAVSDAGMEIQVAPGAAGGVDDDALFPWPAHRLASILYTSGTTGRPKGVMLSAGNLSANVHAILNYLELRPADRTLCALPFCYAYGNSVMHTQLASGACLVIEDSLLYPVKTLELMDAEAVTGFSGVPSTFRHLLARCALERFPLPHLRYVTQAGGPLAPGDVNRLRAFWPQADFFVMYGQTEACSRISYLPPNEWERKAGSVGHAVTGVQIAVRDVEGKSCGVSEEGEVWVRGPNVMLGYWRDENATAEKIDNGWLSTGDLGYLDDEGYLTLVGRSSAMIKTGGHRVAPEEIEQVLTALEQVEDAAVAGRDDDLLGEIIKAFVVVKPGCEVSRRDILAACRKELAPYKLPREIAVVPGLPHTVSGKIQRWRLSSLDRFGRDCV